MAPWDIGSDEANSSFAPSGAPWNYNVGIEFRISEKMTDSTRFGYNETVTQKWFYNNESQKMEKDFPDFVLYVKYTNEKDIKEDPMYKMCLKAAAQLGVPLKIFNFEKNLEREQLKIEKYLKIFTGEEKNDTGLTEEKILERIIVDIENNRSGLKFADRSFREAYFTDEMRDRVYERIHKVILKYKDTDAEKHKKILSCFKNVLKDEVLRQISTTGESVSDLKNKTFFLNQMYLCKGKKIEGRHAKKERIANSLISMYKNYEVTLEDTRRVEEVFSSRNGNDAGEER